MRSIFVVFVILCTFYGSSFQQTTEEVDTTTTTSEPFFHSEEETDNHTQYWNGTHTIEEVLQMNDDGFVTINTTVYENGTIVEESSKVYTPRPPLPENGTIIVGELNETVRFKRSLTARSQSITTHLSSFQTYPRSLKKLIFGDENFDASNEHILNLLFKNSSNPDVQCVQKCNKNFNFQNYFETSGNDVCRTNDDSQECYENCNGVFSTYIKDNSKKATDFFCENGELKESLEETHNKLEKCIDKVSEEEQLHEKLHDQLEKGLKQLETSNSNQETCMIFKNVLLDEVTKILNDACPENQELFETFNTLIVYFYTIISDGGLIERCPELYES